MMRLLLIALLTACADPKDDATDDTDVVVETDDTTEDTTSAAWQTVAEELGGALLSITGNTADDVWTVGAQDADGPLVLHYDGAWTRVPAAPGGDLWWAWLPPAGSDNALWAVGELGRVLRYDGAAWAPEEVTDAAITLFGCWGSDEDHVWAVGGDTSGAGDGAAIFFYDGDAWTRQPLPEAAAAQVAIFKVWGTSATDVWTVGNNGIVLHNDGSGWALVDAGTDRNLLTIAGEGPDEVYAVGGLGNAEVIHWDGATWANESPPFAPEFNGVFVRDGHITAVGRTGTVWDKVEGGEWLEDPRGRANFLDLHATWLDPEGGVWAVGGSIATKPLTRGTVVYGGATAIPVYAP